MTEDTCGPPFVRRLRLGMVRDRLRNASRELEALGRTMEMDVALFSESDIQLLARLALELSDMYTRVPTDSAVPDGGVVP